MKTSVEHLLLALQCLAVEFDKELKVDADGERTFQLIRLMHDLSELIRHVQNGKCIGQY